MPEHTLFSPPLDLIRGYGESGCNENLKKVYSFEYKRLGFSLFHCYAVRNYFRLKSLLWVCVFLLELSFFRCNLQTFGKNSL